MRFKLLLLACAALSWPVISRAEVLDWLYAYEAVVASQSIAERNAVIRDGLETVLVRVSGVRELPDRPEIAAAFNQVSNYPLETTYLSRRLVSASENDQETNASRREFVLSVKFDPIAVHELIRASELPIWSSHRPRILLIISTVVGQHRLILGSLTNHPSQAVTRAVANQRGLAITQPLLDLEDLALLQEGSIAFNLVRSFDALQRRYGADVVATARIEPHDFKRYRVWLRSTSFTTDGPQVFDVQSEAKATAESVHRIADSLSNRYAVPSTEDTSLHLTVQGIRTAVAYKSLLDYLQQWEFIDQVLLSSANSNFLQLEIKTGSTWDQFNNYLTGDQYLMPARTQDEYRTDMKAFIWRGSQ